MKIGFNQSLLLAYYLQINLGKSTPELLTHWLKHIRGTPPRTGLPLAERLVNLDDAFEASFKVSNHQILHLVDMTTPGSTLNSIARSLKKGNTSSIGAICTVHEDVEYS